MSSYIDVGVVSSMVDVGSWYIRSCRETARCSMRVADISWSRREADRGSMRVADVGRSW